MQAAQKMIASNNVYIIDKAFYMPQLKRSRRIWLYLPPDYHASKQHYPVLYMQDGQNLFEDWSAFGEEWGVDETLDEMKATCIVVGIDNGIEKRMNEYTLHNHERYGAGEGAHYLSFLVHTLKPYIDETYRTLPGRAHTFIAGSSLGGLISFYASLHYPDVFGAAGIFSPAFWIAPQILEEIKSGVAENNHTQRFYFYYGENEGHEMAAHASAVIDLLKTYERYRVKTVVKTDGIHSEAEWRAVFPHFYNWLVPQEDGLLKKLTV